MMGDEDPTLLRMGGHAVLRPMEAGQLYGHMPLSQATAVLQSKIVLAIGADNFYLLTVAARVLGGALVLFVLWRIVQMSRAYFDDPVARRIREIEERDRQRQQQQVSGATAAKGGAGNKSRKAAQRGDGDGDGIDGANDAAHASSASSAPALSLLTTPTCRRTRCPTMSVPTSTLRGFDLVSVCAVSPCGNLLVVSEREKRSVSVFPQHKDFVSSFKSTLNVSQPLAAVESSKPLVTSAHFAPDGRYLALYDVATHSVHVLRNDTSAQGSHTAFQPSACVTHLYRWKVADAAGLTPVVKGHTWGSQFAALLPTGDRMLSFYHNDGCLMLYSRDGARLASNKRSLGNTVAWGHSGAVAACSGSTMSETCLYHVRIRDSGSAAATASNSKHHANHHAHHQQQHGAGDATASVSLDRFGPTLSPAGLRMSHVLLAPDASLVMMLPATAAAITVSFLQGVNLENGDAPEVSLVLEDEDFLHPSLRGALHVEMLHLAPNPTLPDKKVCFVTLRVGGDVVVYRVDAFEAASASAAAPPRCHRVLEVHGAHDDNAIIGSGVVGRGRGLVTATERDSKKVLRCWDLNNHA